MIADTGRIPLPEGAAALRGDVVSCWMCGTHQYSNQMLADGGAACDDIRWYCRDPQACTERSIISPAADPHRLSGEQVIPSDPGR